MSAPHKVTRAIRNLNEQLAQLSLPEETDETLTLVVQQQQLLAAYVHSALPSQIDYDLIRDVLKENSRLMGKAKRAHSDAALNLDALALGRSAVSAYEGILAKELRAPCLASGPPARLPRLPWIDRVDSYFVTRLAFLVSELYSR